MKKKIYPYILYLCLGILFCSCTILDINQADIYAARKQYHYSLLQLDSYLKKGQETKSKILQKYEQLWNEGNEYYDNIIQQNKMDNLKAIASAKEYKFLMHRHFSSLPNSIKSKFSGNIYLPLDVTKLQKETVDAYTNLGNSIGNTTYLNRLHQNFAYKKAMKYSSNPSFELQQKWNFSKNHLERNIYVHWNGYTDSFFRNVLITKIQNLLMDSELFTLSNRQNAQIHFEVNIENYQLSNSPPNLKRETKYKTISVPHQKTIVKVPYQELTFSKRYYLSYVFIYKLIDNDGNIIFSGYKPCKTQEEKTWKQFIPLDDRYDIQLPNNQEEPKGKSEEDFITESFSSSVKEIQLKLNQLSNG